MIERKAKICKTCQTLQYIWAYGNCHTCDGKERAGRVNLSTALHSVPTGKIVPPKVSNEVRKPIPKLSSKQAKINQAYTVLKKQFFKDKPLCGIEFQNCTRIATDIHHKGIGSNKRKYYNDTTTWVQCCRHCHDTAHDLSAVEQYALGLRIRT